MAEQNKQLKTRIAHKHDLEVNWMKAVNFLPKAGELIVYSPEVDANGSTLTMIVDGKAVPALPPGRNEPYTVSRLKIGDGYHYVNDLEFIGGITKAVVEEDFYVFYCGDSDILIEDPFELFNKDLYVFGCGDSDELIENPDS